MASRTYHRWMWRIGLLTVLCLPLLVVAQQAAKSDADLARQGALALALAHGDKPRYGGKFVSVGNEEIPFYDMHQTSLGGIYAAVAPAYNCLIRTSPYDPKGQEIMPELADTWEISDGGKTLTFHLHQGVKWHDGVPFSSADVKYTIERIMRPPEGMVSPRGPVFNALIERVEAPDPDTVVVYGKGPSALLLPLFASGHNMIIPKHIVEPDPVNTLKTRVIGTGPFRLKEPPTTSLWKYERNPEYSQKGLPYLDEIEIHLITDPQAMVAALLSKRVYWSDVFAHANMDCDLAKSTVQQAVVCHQGRSLVPAAFCAGGLIFQSGRIPGSGWVGHASSARTSGSGSGPSPVSGGGAACVAILLYGPLFAYGFKHELLRVLDEGSPQVSGRLEPVDGARQDDTAGTLPIEFWMIHTRGDFAFVS